MIDNIDPSMIAVAFAIWPTARAIVLLTVSSIIIWSPHEDRRRTAERLLGILQGGGHERRW